MGFGFGKLLAGLVLWAVAACASAQGISKDSIDLRLAESSRALPDEINAMAAQLKELSPGLWESNRGNLFLAVGVANRSDQALPLSSFGLQLGDQFRSDSVLFECSPERYQPTAALAPRAQAAFLCRAGVPSTGSSAGVARYVAALRLDPQAMSIKSREPPPRAVERRPSPQQEAAARAAARPSAAVKTAPEPALRKRGVSSFEQGLFSSGKHVFFLLVVLAFAYYGAARTIGNRQAAIFFWIILTAYFGSIMAREGLSGSGWRSLAVIVVPGLMMGAAALAWGFHALYDFVTSDWETIKLRIFHILLGLIGLSLLMLING